MRITQRKILENRADNLNVLMEKTYEKEGLSPQCRDYAKRLIKTERALTRLPQWGEVAEKLYETNSYLTQLPIPGKYWVIVGESKIDLATARDLSYLEFRTAYPTYQYKAVDALLSRRLIEPVEGVENTYRLNRDEYEAWIANVRSTV